MTRDEELKWAETYEAWAKDYATCAELFPDIKGGDSSHVKLEHRLWMKDTRLALQGKAGWYAAEAARIRYEISHEDMHRRRMVVLFILGICFMAAVVTAPMWGLK